jgi:hydrogenase nickel incorporation protein HypA/HybF
MHELSIALSIIDLVAEQAELYPGRVVGVHLKLGVLSGVVPAALLSAWEQAKAETPFSDARLLLQEMPVRIFCGVCQVERPAESLQLLSCRICGTPASRVVSGRELELSTLEITDEPANATGGSSAEGFEAE